MSPAVSSPVPSLHGPPIVFDVAIGSPPNVPPTMTILGPTLAPLELAGRKLLALFGRAEAREFADVYILAKRFGKDVLVERAATMGAGFDARVLSQMMVTLGRFSEDEIPLTTDAMTGLRAFFGAGRRVLGPKPCGSLAAGAHQGAAE